MTAGSFATRACIHNLTIHCSHLTWSDLRYFVRFEIRKLI